MALRGDWRGVYREVKAMKGACGPSVHMKSILAVGELGTMENVYKVWPLTQFYSVEFS